MIDNISYVNIKYNSYIIKKVKNGMTKQEFYVNMAADFITRSQPENQNFPVNRTQKRSYNQPTGCSFRVGIIYINY